jgi:hypothetical protein
MDNCVACQFHVEPECRRYPPGERGFARVGAGAWCGEFKEKEVVVCPVEEKVKEEKARVEEKAVVSEPEVKKRGWPLGKPRK